MRIVWGAAYTSRPLHDQGRPVRFYRYKGSFPETPETVTMEGSGAESVDAGESGASPST